MTAARTVGDMLHSWVSRDPDGEALVGDGVRHTYRSLEIASGELARALVASGVTKYGRVAVHAANSPEWVVAWLAITRIGAVAVPLSTFATGPELVRSLRHADCQALVTRSGPRPHAVDLLAHLIPSIGDPSPLFCADLPFLRTVLDISPDGSALAGPSIAALAATVDPALISAMEGEVHASDPATMVYTSGSTSAPKGVVHSHHAVVTQTHNLVDELRFDNTVRNLTLLPFFWVGGMMLTLLPTLAAGGMVATVAGFDPGEVLRLIEEERLTRASVYPPANLAAVVAHPDMATRDLSSLQRSVPGFPPEGFGLDVGPMVSDSHDGLTMGLGMSETLSAYWWGTPDAANPITPPLTRTTAGAEVRVVSDDGSLTPPGSRGEIRVRAPFVTIGLQKVDRDAVFDPDGFYRTGDIGEVMADHRIRFCGRSSDIIRANGANVSSAEVVAALMRIDGVVSAHVVGIPDVDRGAVVAAAVITDGRRGCDAESIREALTADIARYKVPTIIRLVNSEDIPTTATSKVDQPALRALLSDVDTHPETRLPRS